MATLRRFLMLFVLQTASFLGAILAIPLPNSHTDLNKRAPDSQRQATKSSNGDWDIIATATAVLESNDANMHFMRPMPTESAFVGMTESALLHSRHRRHVGEKTRHAELDAEGSRSHGDLGASSRQIISQIKTTRGRLWKRSTSQEIAKPIRSPLYRITIDIPRLDYRRSAGLPLENPQPEMSKETHGRSLAADDTNANTQNANNSTFNTPEQTEGNNSEGPNSGNQAGSRSDNTYPITSEADPGGMGSNNTSDDSALDTDDDDDAAPVSDDHTQDNNDDVAEQEKEAPASNISNAEEESDDNDEAPTALPETTGEPTEAPTGEQDSEKVSQQDAPETEVGDDAEAAPTGSPEESEIEPTTATDVSEAPTEDPVKKSRLAHAKNKSSFASDSKTNSVPLAEGKMAPDGWIQSTYSSEPGINEAALQQLEEGINAVDLTKKSTLEWSQKNSFNQH